MRKDIDPCMVFGQKLNYASTFPRSCYDIFIICVDQKGRVSKVRFADVPSLPGDVTASSSKQPGSRPTEGDNTEQQEFYDNVYFDSSGSEGSEDGDGGEGGEGGEDVGRKVRKLTNDELFYDPTIDDDNERWVQRQRMAYHNGRLIVQTL